MYSFFTVCFVFGFFTYQGSAGQEAGFLVLVLELPQREVQAS